MSITAEFDAEIEKDIDKITAKVVEFNGDLVAGSPVDTGTFKSAWELIKTGRMTWLIYNSMEYASILWNGRMTINGKTYGSKQGWGLEGGDPLLMKFNKELDDII